MNKNILFYLCMVFVLSSLIFDCSNDIAGSRDTGGIDLKIAKMTASSTGKTFYFVGTMSIGDSSVSPLHPKITQLLGGIDCLVTQLSLLENEVENLKKVKIIQSNNRLANGKTFETYQLPGESSSFFTRTESIVLESLIKKLNAEYVKMDADLTNFFPIEYNFEPAYLTSVFVGGMYVYLNFSAKNEISQQLYNSFKAIAPSSQYVTLETIEEGISVIFAVDEKDQMEDLKFTLSMLSSPKYYTPIQELIDKYKKQDIAYFANLAKEMKTENSSAYEKSVSDRSVDWATKIDTWAKDSTIHNSAKTYLVAVGMWNLAGPDSLQNKLSDLGYTVSDLE